MCSLVSVVHREPRITSGYLVSQTLPSTLLHIHPIGDKVYVCCTSRAVRFMRLYSRQEAMV